MRSSLSNTVLGRQAARLRRVIKKGKTPEQTALAFSMGVFIAFTPLLGFHFVSAVLLAWLFRLSLPALFTGAAINNPLTIAPIYGFCLWVGIKLVGGHEPRTPIEWQFSTDMLPQLKPLITQFVTGTLVVGAVGAVVSYVLFYWLASRWLVVKRRVGARVTPRTPREDQTPTES